MQDLWPAGARSDLGPALSDVNNALVIQLIALILRQEAACYTALKGRTQPLRKGFQTAC
jgi:hypothetical protein